MRRSTLTLPFALVSAMAAWLGVGLGTGIRELLSPLIAGAAGATLGQAASTSPPGERGSRIAFWVPIIGAITGLSMDIHAGAFATKDFSNVRRFVIGAVVALPLYTVAAALVSLMHRLEDSRDDSLVRGSYERAVLGVVVVSVAAMILGVHLYGPPVDRGVEIVVCSVLVVAAIALTAREALALVGVRRHARAAREARPCDAQRELPVVDFGVGAERREVVERGNAAYRAMDRALCVYVGDGERAFAHVGRAMLLSGAAAVLSLTGLGMARMRGAAPLRYDQAGEEQAIEAGSMPMVERRDALAIRPISGLDEEELSLLSVNGESAEVLVSGRDARTERIDLRTGRPLARSRFDIHTRWFVSSGIGGDDIALVHEDPHAPAFAFTSIPTGAKVVHSPLDPGAFAWIGQRGELSIARAGAPPVNLPKAADPFFSDVGDLYVRTGGCVLRARAPKLDSFDKVHCASVREGHLTPSARGTRAVFGGTQVNSHPPVGDYAILLGGVLETRLSIQGARGAAAIRGDGVVVVAVSEGLRVIDVASGASATAYLPLPPRLDDARWLDDGRLVATRFRGGHHEIVLLDPAVAIAEEASRTH